MCRLHAPYYLQYIPYYTEVHLAFFIHTNENVNVKLKEPLPERPRAVGERGGEWGGGGQNESGDIP